MLPPRSVSLHGAVETQFALSDSTHKVLLDKICFNPILEYQLLPLK